MSILVDLGKVVLPRKVLDGLRQRKIEKETRVVEGQGKLTEHEMDTILKGGLGLRKGDTVLVHSSTNMLNLDFPANRLLGMIKDAVGEEGTTIFPTYPKVSSIEFLKSGEVFDVRRTPSFTGMITELARRDRSSERSIHPTKSVCAIGPNAKKLTGSHHLSRSPYDDRSPYQLMMGFEAKIIGLGVSSSICTYLHAVEDRMGDDFPVNVYHRKRFDARCRDRSGNELTVSTPAHNAMKMNHDFSAFQRKYIPDDLCKEFVVRGRTFYRADSSRMFDELVRLAEKGLTMYPLRSYRLGRIFNRSI